MFTFFHVVTLMARHRCLWCLLVSDKDEGNGFVSRSLSQPQSQRFQGKQLSIRGMMAGRAETSFEHTWSLIRVWSQFLDLAKNLRVGWSDACQCFFNHTFSTLAGQMARPTPEP